MARSTKVNKFSPRSSEELYLYTKGGEFSLDGVEYVGEYHKNNGIVYTGPTPSKQSKLLRKLYNNPDHYRYDQLFDFSTPASLVAEPTPHIYSPKQTAYTVGFDTRYFVEKRNDTLSYAVEVNQEQFKAIGRVGGIDAGLYHATTVSWKLTGTLGSIEQHNRLEIFKASKTVPSIAYAIKNFTEFARVTQLETNQHNSSATPIVEDMPNINQYKQSILNLYSTQQFLSSSV